MPGYTSSQIATLQGYISAAQSALSSGNTSAALSNINSYYSSQTGFRGYASDALQVVNNTGLFGTVANQELSNSLGQSNYAALMPKLAVQLAAADLQVIQNNPNSVPTEDDIANYHASVFSNDGISLSAWGGSAAAALGVDWSQGTLTPAETDANLGNNYFAQNFNQSQTFSALSNLEVAGLQHLSAGSFSGTAAAIGTLYALQQIYDYKYSSNTFNYAAPPGLNPVSYSGSSGQFVDVYQSQDSSDGIVYFTSAADNSSGSLQYSAGGQDFTLSVQSSDVSFAPGTNGELKGSSNTVNASDLGYSSQLQEGRSVALDVTGNDNTVSQGNNTRSVTYLDGTGNHVTDDSGSDTSYLVATGSQAFIDGDATGAMLGSNEQINSTGIGFTGVAADKTSGDSFFGNATQAFIGTGTTGALVYGNTNTVSDADNTDSSFNVYGQNLTVGGVSGNNQLGLSGQNTEAVVYGNGTVISTISDQTLHEMSSGGTVEVANDVTGDVIYADHTTIYENQSDNIKVEGSYDQIYGNSTDTNTGDQDGYTGANGYGSSSDDGSSGDGGDGGGGGYSPPPYDPPPYDGGDGGDGGGGGDYGYDFAAGASVLKASNNAALGSIAAFDKAIGDTLGEAEANTARAQASLAMSLTGEAGAATTAAVTGVAWQPTPAADGSRTITFSFAEGAVSAADPFSSFIGAQYQSTIEKALQAWSTATGLTFEQVADSPNSNIRIGFSDFGTATSGVLGYTDGQSSTATGTIQSAVIRLEDPLETALSSLGAGGTYAGAGATLYQVALHEIGRALGFADNADPNSVMYATASSSNQTLDATDLAGAQLVYGSAAAVTAETDAALAAMPQGGSASGTATPLTASTPPQTIGSASATPDAQSGVNQLVQAMATFSPQESASPLGPIAAQNTALATELAAPLHH